jgi:hypothetical protein
VHISDLGWSHSQPGFLLWIWERGRSSISVQPDSPDIKSTNRPALPPLLGRMGEETEIREVDLEKLEPAPYNPREISSEASGRLSHSIGEFGLVEPIVWNERTGHVVGGHQRLKVLEQTGASVFPLSRRSFCETLQLACGENGYMSLYPCCGIESVHQII